MEKAHETAIAGTVWITQDILSVGDRIHMKTARFDYGDFIVREILPSGEVKLAFPSPNDPRKGKLPIDFL